MQKPQSWREFQLREKPYFTYGLAAVNILVFFVLELLGDTEEDTIFMLKMGAMQAEYVAEQGQYWRLLTSNFLHFGFGHLINNMLILFCAGPILEKALGHIKYLLLYLCAGVGGSILSCLMMLHSGDLAVSAGASGAIFGIIGALLWIVLRHQGRYETLTGRGLLFMIVITIYYGISNAGIDNWGHVGGLLAGFLLGVFFYRKKPKTVDFNDESLYT